MIGWRVMAGAASKNASTIEYNFLQTAVDVSDSSIYTFPAQNLGPEKQDRTIVICVGMRCLPPVDLLSITVGGISAILDTQGSNLLNAQTYVAIAHAVVPVGTIGDVVVTFNGPAVRCAVALYHVTGGTLIAVDTDAAATYSCAVANPEGGLVIATRFVASALGTTWLGVMEDYDVDVETRAFSGGSTKRSGTIVSYTTGGTYPMIAAVAYALQGGQVTPPAITNAYLEVAIANGAISLMDGFIDAVDSEPLINNGCSLVSLDPYGHKALFAPSGGYLSRTIQISYPAYTFVGATYLGGSTSNYSRLCVFDAGGASGFLGRAAARSIAGVPRETFNADEDSWHWFAYTVDHTNALEVTRVYRDGLVLTEPIIADHTSFLIEESVCYGGIGISNRNIGYFSACGLFNSALTSTQVADLYAAYQRGP